MSAYSRDMDTYPDSAELQEIREFIEAATDAQNDPDALLTLHLSGAVIVNIAGRRILGRADLDAAMRQALSSPLRDVRTTVELVDLRRIAPDVVLASCTKTVHDNRPVTERHERAVPTTGAMTYLLVNTDAGWRIALAQTTPTAA